jgi:hypothetical protein
MRSGRAPWKARQWQSARAGACRTWATHSRMQGYADAGRVTGRREAGCAGGKDAARGGAGVLAQARMYTEAKELFGQVEDVWRRG